MSLKDSVRFDTIRLLVNKIYSSGPRPAMRHLALKYRKNPPKNFGSRISLEGAPPQPEAGSSRT